MKCLAPLCIHTSLRRFLTRKQYRYCCTRRFDDTDLSKKSYWEERYSNTQPEVTFDWFSDGRTFVPSLLQIIEKSCEKSNLCRILDVGCGVSDLVYTLNIALNNLKTQRNVHFYLVDYIREALVFQQQRISGERVQNDPSGREKHSPQYFIADVLKLPLKSHSFDIIIDKGTSDSLLKDKHSGADKYKSLVREAYRILNKSGKFIQITDEDPDSRMVRIQNATRDIQATDDSDLNRLYFNCVSLSNGLECFVYVLEK